MEAVYRDYSPKGVRFYYIYKALAHPETNSYVTPYTLQERLMHVKEAKRTLGTQIPWLCDAMTNDAHQALAQAPNSEFIIDPEGRVARRRAWSDPLLLRQDLAKLVGQVDNPTADVPLGKVGATKAGPTGVVPRVETPARMRPLRTEPKESKTPFYVKLIAKVEEQFPRTGKGKLKLTFCLDPLYEVHWNNLAAPLRFELKVPDGATVSATSGEAPKVTEPSDSDPRDFLLEIDRGTATGPIELVVRYFACSDKEGFCVPVTQAYEIHMSGGGPGRPARRPEPPGAAPAPAGSPNASQDRKEQEAGTPGRQPSLKGLKLEKDGRAAGDLESYRFSYPFQKDKEPIQGLLLKPAGNGPFPAVVVNHGAGAHAEAFGRPFGQIFAAKGYVAIACDLTHARRGGDPNTFAGSPENAERILACVSILEGLAYVDPQKLCMYGNSMGAYATVGTCTQTDKIKAAAITAGGVGSRGGLDTTKNAAKIRAAFIILHGSDDKAVSVDRAKNFKAAMDKHGKTAELKIFDGIGHQLCREKQGEVFELILAFFDKQLK